MFTLFPVICFSLFISPNLLRSIPTHPPLPFDNLTDRSTNVPLLVALIFRRIDASFAKTFFAAQQNFPDAVFESITYRNFKSHHPNVPPSPAIAIYENGSIICMQGPIDSESVLAHVLDLQIRRERPILETFDRSLNGGSLTVIGRSGQFDLIRSFALTSRVPTNAIVISEDSASSLELNESECAVYRRDDSTIQKFECNLANYTLNSIPLYSYVTDRTPSSTGRFVFIYLDQPEPIVIDFLTELGLKHPDFRFVYVPKSRSYIATRILNVRFDYLNVNVAVFNFPEQSHYNISHLVPDDDSETFDQNAWLSLIDRILGDVRADKLEIVLLSEQETPRVDGNMQRLAGMNFWRSVNNDTADVFVLFEKGNRPLGYQVYDSYRKFAAAVNPKLPYELNHMTVSGNRISGGFPVSSVPAIVLYPAKNKTALRVCPYESQDVIAWFAQKYATWKHAVPFQLPDAETMEKIEERTAQLVNVTGGEIRERLKETLQELKSDVRDYEKTKEL